MIEAMPIPTEIGTPANKRTKKDPNRIAID